MDFASLSKRIFKSDENIRGVTFGRFDGGIIHFEMRSGVESINPPGSMGKMDAEVLMPSLLSYLKAHEKYFGKVNYIGVKFEKVTMIYIKHDNLFLVLSIQPNVRASPIVEKVQEILGKDIETKSVQSS